VSSRILYVEDDPTIAQVISVSLSDEGFDVTLAENGATGISLAKDREFDLAIVDLRLPDVSGLDVVREIRKTTDIPIVVFTAFGDTQSVVAGLESGADDFLSKPIASLELAARLRAILRRTDSQHGEDTPDQLSVGSLEMNLRTHSASVNGTPVHLTKTEFEVLRELMSRFPEVVTRMNLLERVWGYDYLGDSRLVDMQIYRLRQKLEEHGHKDKLVTVRGVGFQLEE
jgi:two-component system response regulator MtrA